MTKPALPTSTIIIGAGVVGLTIGALHSLTLGPVTVISPDAGQGKGASGTPSAVLLPWDGGKKHEKRLAAYALWKDWQSYVTKESGIDIEFREHGAKRYESETRLPGASLNPTALLSALRKIIEVNGGQIVTDTITSFVLEGFTTASVKGFNTSYSANNYILAAGLGSAPFFTPLGVTESLIGDGGELLGVNSSQHLEHITYVDSLVVSPQHQGIAWIGGVHRKLENTPSYQDDDYARLLSAARKIFGDNFASTTRWAGVRPKIKNYGGPLTTVAPLSRNVVITTGHSSNGFLLAPLTAKESLALLPQ